jgi:hypothetical protein
MTKLLIRDLATLQQYRGSCSPSQVEFRMGELAVDVLESASAEELLVALRGRLPEQDAKKVVGILLDWGLTFDSTLDASVRS